MFLTRTTMDEMNNPAGDMPATDAPATEEMAPEMEAPSEEEAPAM